MKYFSIISLGCPKNLVDSEYFFTIFEKAGYKFSENTEKAEIILINTCGFINDAKEESIDTILETLQLKETGKCKKIFVTGCMVKRYKEDLKASIPEVDEWIDLKDFDELESILNSEHKQKERTILTPKHYAYLRISDGCNNHCSYCAIPSIRGELKSETIEDMLIQAKALADQGVKEIIINAQDTTQYGTDLYGKQSLIDLIKAIHAIDKISWIRLLYLHPAHITETFIDELALLPKICPYFDIPLQHINDNILNAMNRHVTKARIIEILNYIKFKLPEAVIRTTFITGFPGEDRKIFNELLRFIQEFNFGRLGAFDFSPEEGTLAEKMENQISKRTAQNRKDKIMAIQQTISIEYLNRFVDKEIEVIIEKESIEPGIKYEGRSRFDAPEIDGIVFITKGKAKIGDIVNVMISESWEYDLVGEIIQ